MPEPGPGIGESGIEIVTIPCRTDNYAYLVTAAGSGEAVLIDAPEAAPIEAVLAGRGWRLGSILLTHHHGDHTEGVAALRGHWACSVQGPAAEAARLPPLDRGLRGGDRVGAAPLVFTVIDVPGHTAGHVAYHLPAAEAVFTADSLMAAGCGRLFEGTAAQMWDSLARLAALPPATRMFPGHEYTLANLRFALTLDCDNPALISRFTEVEELRRSGRPSVPSTLADEMATNPFLRAGTPALRRAVGMDDAAEAQVFGEIRARKDRF